MEPCWWAPRQRSASVPNALPQVSVPHHGDCSLMPSPRVGRRRWAQDPSRTFYSVKRLIGKDIDDVREDAAQARLLTLACPHVGGTGR